MSTLFLVWSVVEPIIAATYLHIFMDIFTQRLDFGRRYSRDDAKYLLYDP